MTNSTVDMIVDYLINDYIVSFVVCLLGSLLKDMFDNIQNSKKLNIKKIFISTIFSSLLAASIFEYMNKKLSFPLVIFCCFLIGMWGFWILQWVTNYSNIYYFLMNFLKKFGPTGISESMDKNAKRNLEIHEEDKKEIEAKKEKTDDEDTDLKQKKE